MIINPYRFGQPLLLDTYSGAAVAYSVRKLRTAYSGAALRVRRSSDNTESDIGFVANQLDTASLLLFVGAGNGFVTRWYDQSGNARNATQTVAANQPRIVNAGVLDTQNGKPTLIYDGTNDNMSTTGNAFSSTQTTIIAVNKQNSIVNTYKRLVCINQYNAGYYLGSNSNTDDMLAIFNNTNLNCYGGTSINYNLSILYNNSTTGFLFNNGIQVNSISTTVSSYGNQNLFIGTDSFSFSQASEYWNGSVQEVIVYPNSQSSNISALNTNINSYFNIYP